jgi:hypothetical protein
VWLGTELRGGVSQGKGWLDGLWLASVDGEGSVAVSDWIPGLRGWGTVTPWQERPSRGHG